MIRSGGSSTSSTFVEVHGHLEVGDSAQRASTSFELRHVCRKPRGWSIELFVSIPFDFSMIVQERFDLILLSATPVPRPSVVGFVCG